MDSWIWNFGKALGRRGKENRVLGHGFLAFGTSGWPWRAVGKKTMSWDIVFLDLNLRESPGAP